MASPPPLHLILFVNLHHFNPLSQDRKTWIRDVFRRAVSHNRLQTEYSHPVLLSTLYSHTASHSEPTPVPVSARHESYFS